MEATETINIITETVTKTKIRSWIEIETDTETTETADTSIDRTQTKTDTDLMGNFVEELCFSRDQEHRGGLETELLPDRTPQSCRQAERICPAHLECWKETENFIFLLLEMD